MSKIKRNIFYNIVYQILVLIVPLITSPYISRVLGAEGVGTYSYVSSVAYYFFIIVTMGLTNYGNRNIAKHRNDQAERSRIFWSIYFMQLMTGSCVLVAYIFYTFFLADGGYKIYFGIYVLYILGACLDINWFFFGMENFKLTTIRNTIVKLITVIMIFAFVKNGKALVAYFVIVAGSTLMSNAILWTKIFEYVKFYKPTFKECIYHLKPNFVLFLPILAMSIYRVMDKIMIKMMSGVIQNGYYENADRIITISLTAFSAIATVMMPAISNMVANKQDDSIKKMLRDMMQIINCLSIAMVFGLVAIAREFAPLFFGEEFSETGFLLIGLAPTIFMSGWKNVLRSQFLIPYEKDKAYIISLVCGALVNVVVNSICIPLYAARGAIIGTICAELIGFVIQTYVASMEICIIELFKNAIIFVPAGAIMGIVIYVILNILPYNIVSIFACIIIGALIYIILSSISLFLLQRQRFGYFKEILYKSLKRKNVK